MKMCSWGNFGEWEVIGWKMVVSSYRDVLEITCAMFNEYLWALRLEISDLRKRITQNRKQNRQGKPTLVVQIPLFDLFCFFYSHKGTVGESAKPNKMHLCTHRICIPMVYGQVILYWYIRKLFLFDSFFFLRVSNRCDPDWFYLFFLTIWKDMYLIQPVCLFQKITT